MNFKPYSFIKFSFGLLGTVTLFLVVFYTFQQNRNNFQMYRMTNVCNPRLRHLSQLLSDREQAALIRLIVKESLKELMQVRNNLPRMIFSQQTIDPILIQRRFHKVSILHNNNTVRNSKLKAFQIQITVEERHQMYTLLEVFDKIMKTNNMTYFMYSGTLLGSFRHHDLIPWDDDLDVMLPKEDYDKIPTILAALAPEFIFYRATSHDKLFQKGSRKTSSYNWQWPYLDISYYEENGTHIKDIAKTYDTWYYFPREIVFPLHNRPLLNLSLPAPKDTFAFLVWSYQYGSPCEMYGYSHMVEGAGPSGSTKCLSLADKFPFVEHIPDSNGVREILMYKDLEINNVVIDEPKYAIAEMFSLTLKKGFKIPSEIMPPTT